MAEKISSIESGVTIIPCKDIKSFFKECFIECFKLYQEPAPAPVQLPSRGSIKFASEITGYEVSYIRDLIREKAIPFHQKIKGGRITFHRDELELWMQNGRPNIFDEVIARLSDNWENKKNGGKP